jgi:hypothetical protein
MTARKIPGIRRIWSVKMRGIKSVPGKAPPNKKNET